MTNTKVFTNEKGEMTKLEKFTALREMVSNEVITQTAEVLSFIDNEIALLEKRSTSRKASDKPTKAQKEKLENIEKVEQWFVASATDGVFYNLQEIGALALDLPNATPQKMSPILKEVNEDIVEKGTDEDKKVAYKKTGSVLETEVVDEPETEV